MGRALRLIVGFILACIAAGAALVLFVVTPAELVDAPSDQIGEAALRALAIGTHTAIFASPFALIGILMSEWKGYASWLFAVLTGVVIAVIGFATQYAGEAEGPVTIANLYALCAFITAGIAGGLVYWIVTGNRTVAPTAGDTDGDKPLSKPFAVKEPTIPSAGATKA